MPSKAKNKDTKAPKDRANAPRAAGLPGQGFDSLVEANAKAAEIWLESWARLAGESADFVTRRWARDLALVERICACRTPVELLQVQSEFMQRALADYMHEASRLGDMETDAGVAEIEALDEGLRKAGGGYTGGDDS